jgi:hypothetical protein
LFYRLIISEPVSLNNISEVTSVLGNIGKVLILFGSIILLIGVLLLVFDKIPFFGKLPGDIVIRKKNFVIYIPIVTSIILSLVLSLILFIISKIR